MRPLALLAPLLLFGAGCTHLALERKTLNQVSTVSDIRYKEVLDNLAATVSNPANLPYFSLITGGGTEVVDTGTANPTTAFDRTGFTSQMLSLTGTRTVQDNWTVDPIKDPDRLAAIRCVLQIVTGAGDAVCPDCAKLLTDYKVAGELDKMPVGWFHVGHKHDVPKDAYYWACCHGTYVWVTRDGLEGLTRLTLIIMDVATVDPSPGPTKTVESYAYDDKGKLLRVEKQVVPADTAGSAPSQPAAGPLKGRTVALPSSGILNLLQFRQGVR